MLSWKLILLTKSIPVRSFSKAISHISNWNSVYVSNIRINRESFKGLSSEFTLWQKLYTSSTAILDIRTFFLKKTEFFSAVDTTVSFSPGLLQIKQLELLVEVGGNNRATNGGVLLISVCFAFFLLWGTVAFNSACST